MSGRDRHDPKRRIHSTRPRGGPGCGLHRGRPRTSASGVALLTDPNAVAPGRARLRRLLLALIALLYVISIPWYRTAGEETGTLLGLPSWVAVALLCYAAAAVANAAAWLLSDIPDAPVESNRGEDAP